MFGWRERKVRNKEGESPALILLQIGTQWRTLDWKSLLSKSSSPHHVSSVLRSNAPEDLSLINCQQLHADLQYRGVSLWCCSCSVVAKWSGDRTTLSAAEMSQTTNQNFNLCWCFKMLWEKCDLKLTGLTYFPGPLPYDTAYSIIFQI